MKGSLTKAERANYDTLKRVFMNGNDALIRCKDKASGKNVAVIAAVVMEGSKYNIIPIAKLFDGNPYEELIDPETAMNEDKEGK